VGLEEGSTLEEVLLLASRVLRTLGMAIQALHAHAFVVGLSVGNKKCQPGCREGR
jgi:hypothetical protein